MPEIYTSQHRQQARTTCPSQSFCLCQISVYFPIHSRICPRIYTYVHNYTLYIIAVYIVKAGSCSRVILSDSVKFVVT